MPQGYTMSCKSLGSGGVRLRLLAREMGKRTTMYEKSSCISSRLEDLYSLWTGRDSPHAEAPMRIGDLARECSVNPKTIRYYEAFGLLPKAARAPTGHRIYSEKDLRRLQFIRRAKQIGLPLASIRQVTTYADTGSCQHLRPRLKELIAAQLAEIEGRMKDLRALQRALRGHYASLGQPEAPPRSDTGCSCLDGSPEQTAILPRTALVKRSPRRKS